MSLPPLVKGEKFHMKIFTLPLLDKLHEHWSRRVHVTLLSLLAFPPLEKSYTIATLSVAFFRLSQRRFQAERRRSRVFTSLSPSISPSHSLIHVGCKQLHFRMGQNALTACAARANFPSLAGDGDGDTWSQRDDNDVFPLKQRFRDRAAAADGLKTRHRDVHT